MRNLEIKTRYDDLDLARQLALSLGAKDGGVSQDADTYFRVQYGRLKLRQAAGGFAWHTHSLRQIGSGREPLLRVPTSYGE